MNGRFIQNAASPGLDHLLEGLERVADHLTAGSPVPRPELAARPGAGPDPPLVPEMGQDFDSILTELLWVAGGATRAAHDGWMGHMDPPPTWSSVLGTAAGALLNNNLLMPEMAPSLTRLEEEITRGFASAFGLGRAARGTLTSGGSLANLLALTVARTRALDRLGRAGMEHGKALERLTVVGSETAHISISRGTRLLGLDPGRGLLEVPPAADGTLDPQLVDREIRRASEDGRICFALVATAGTTVLGAVDPLEDLAEVARAHGLWYHVDAAYGGALALSRQRRGVLAGIHAADSITVNPQKWLYVAKVCTLVLFRDGAAWADAMGPGAPYGLSPNQGDPRPAQVEGTRAADVLGLRLALLHHGRRGIEELIERSYGLAGEVERRVRERPFLELAAPAATNVVVFRCAADGREAAGRRTMALHRRLLERAEIFLSLPSFRSSRWLRAVLLNPFTTRSTIDRLFDEVDAWAADGNASAKFR